MNVPSRPAEQCRAPDGSPAPVHPGLWGPGAPAAGTSAPPTSCATESGVARGPIAPAPGCRPAPGTPRPQPFVARVAAVRAPSTTPFLLLAFNTGHKADQRHKLRLGALHAQAHRRHAVVAVDAVVEQRVGALGNARVPRSLVKIGR